MANQHPSPIEIETPRFCDRNMIVAAFPTVWDYAETMALSIQEKDPAIEVMCRIYPLYYDHSETDEEALAHGIHVVFVLGGLHEQRGFYQQFFDKDKIISIEEIEIMAGDIYRHYVRGPQEQSRMWIN